MNYLLFGGFGSSFLGLVLYVVGIATARWVTLGVQGVPSAEIGLWNMCLSSSIGTHCTAFSDISQLPSAFNAARAFAVIEALLLFAGLVEAYIATRTNSPKGKKICGALSIAAGICGVTAAIIFYGHNVARANVVPGVSFSYGYSFHLTWVQAIFTVFGGVAIIKAGRRGEEDPDELPMHVVRESDM